MKMNLKERIRITKFGHGVRIVNQTCRYISTFIPIRFFYISYLKREYRKKTGRVLNLQYPKTFNDKLQWYKVYYRDPFMTQCADKVQVRLYVEETIGNKYLNTIYGIYDSAKEIDWNDLPDEFVVKSNHASGEVILVEKNKHYNIKELEWVLDNEWLRYNYFFQSGEWVYKDIKPKILIEQKLEGEIVDYKVFCFNGQARFIETIAERDSGELKINFFDTDWNVLDIKNPEYPNGVNYSLKPKTLIEMLEMSNKLASRFPFARIDWYENQGRLLFGEITFFPANGFRFYLPENQNIRIGNMFQLNVKKDEL